MIENPTRQQNKHSFMCSSPHWNIQPRSLPYTLMITFIRCSSGVKSVIERKLSTVFPFGLNHSAKVSLNTSCFLYVSDRDVLFFIIIIIVIFKSTAPKWDNPRFHEGLSLRESEHARFPPSLSLLVLRLGGKKTRVTIHSAPAPV